MSRKDQIADAAIDVVADGGTRQLTHRAVDTRAGLAQGSTSNIFRTRTALIEGILNRLIERERSVLDALQPASAPVGLSQAELVELAAAMVRDALGPGRNYTLARRALFTDANSSVQLRTQLERASRYWWNVVGAILQTAGVPDERRRARWLLAYLDGIIADQLARPERRFDARAALAPAIYGILQFPDPASSRS